MGTSQAAIPVKGTTWGPCVEYTEDSVELGVDTEGDKGKEREVTVNYPGFPVYVMGCSVAP